MAVSPLPCPYIQIDIFNLTRSITSKSLFTVLIALHTLCCPPKEYSSYMFQKLLLDGKCGVSADDFIQIVHFLQGTNAVLV